MVDGPVEYLLMAQEVWIFHDGSPLCGVYSCRSLCGRRSHGSVARYCYNGSER
jgi:hypothetical protein